MFLFPVFRFHVEAPRPLGPGNPWARRRLVSGGHDVIKVHILHERPQDHRRLVECFGSTVGSTKNMQ